MMDGEAAGRRWLVLLARLPAEPARHRMALWRELRRSGAIPLGQAGWAGPGLAGVGAVVGGGCVRWWPACLSGVSARPGACWWLVRAVMGNGTPPGWISSTPRLASWS